MKKENLKKEVKEIARDLIALGSLPFYLLVLIRVYIGNFPEIFYPLLISLPLIYIFYFIFKSNNYSAMSIPLFIFTSIFYKEMIFTIFAFVLMTILFICLFYLNYEKKKILLGLLAGIIASAVSYALFLKF